MFLIKFMNKNKALWDYILLLIRAFCIFPGGSGEDFSDVIEVALFPEKGHPYLPTSVPREFEPRLAKLHGNPLVWWVGRFIQYLVRENDSTRKMLQQLEEKMKLQKPYVG